MGLAAIMHRKADYTATPTLPHHHRVRDNHLGTGVYVPMIRRTAKLASFQTTNLDEKATMQLSHRHTLTADVGTKFILQEWYN